MKTILDKKALVTGAASGIGKAISLELARAGADLFLLDVDDVGLARTAGEIRRLGREAHVRHCDLASLEQIDAATTEILSRWEGIDILVNNAGVAYYGPTECMYAEQWNRVLDVNLRAPCRLIHTFLPGMLQQEESHILNVASIAGLVGGGRYVAYHTSKFGLVGLSESLRMEMSRRGVGVTAVCPGPVLTGIYANADCGRTGESAPAPPRWVCTTAEVVARKAVKAIRRNRRLVLVTPLAHLLFNAKRFAPWLFDLLSFAERRRKGIKRRKVAMSQPRRAAA